MDEIILELRVKKAEGVALDLETLKEMLLLNGTSVLCEGCPVYHGNDIVGRIIAATVITKE